MNSAEAVAVIMRGGALPDNLIPEIACTEDCIENDFEVVAGGGVAVEVKTPGGFEDAVHFNDSDRHHDEVGHHWGFIEELP